MLLSALPSRQRFAHRLLLICTVVAGWGCSVPNPDYRPGSDDDAASIDDAMGLPDAMPDALVEPPMPIVEPPGADALPVPPEPPPDAAMPVDANSDASPRDTPVAPTDTARDVLPAPVLTLDKVVYSPGEDIVVSFFNGPGNAADWIGIYDENAAPPSDASRSLLWYYTDNKGWETRGAGVGPRAGAVTFGVGSKGSRQWPLPTGRYKAIFLSTPYTQLSAPAPFQVR